MATRGLIIIEIKDGNELAIISLPVYFKSVKKWKYVLSKKKGKQNNQKNSKKKLSSVGVEPQTFWVQSQCITYCAMSTNVKQNHWINYLYHFCPRNSAAGGCLNLVEPYLWGMSSWKMYLRKQA